MKKFLKKKITIKITVGRMLLESIEGALGCMVGFFLIIAFFSTDVVEVLNVFVQIFSSVSEGKISALELTLLFTPAILVLFVTIRLGIIIVKFSNNK